MASTVDEHSGWDDVQYFPALWLRDNCPCGECRDPRSQQKRFRIVELDGNVAVSNIEERDDEIVIDFLPDGHRATFPRSWFTGLSAMNAGDGRSELGKSLWSARDLEAQAHDADWNAYCNDPLIRFHVLRDVLTFGFAILHGTPTEQRTVLDIARSFGFVRETNYGQLFDVRVETDPNNLAFTGSSISPHTDNPYRDPVPTVQLLHCLSNDVDGGESGLVDGFRAAALLRDESRDHFNVLTSTPVTFAWGDERTALRAQSPMIELDPRGRIRGVRFNNRSMQTLWLDARDLAEYYDAYRAFALIVERPELMMTFRLDSGDCVIFDNTRILHARTAFSESDTGKRHLQGCYADLDGLASSVSLLERMLEV